MMVMPGNDASMRLGYLAGKYPGKIGWIMSPDHWKEPRDYIPYGLDNGCWNKWDEPAFYAHCERTVPLKHKPRWIAVPDVVADREATLRSWFLHSPQVARYGCPLAFVVQDGMTPADIPPNADVVFVGGSTAWKWATLETWCKAHPRVHVGRVNGERPLWLCHKAGAESCDGTGWFRGDKKQLAGLLRYLDESSRGEVRRYWKQEEMAL